MKRHDYYNSHLVSICGSSQSKATRLRYGSSVCISRLTSGYCKGLPHLCTYLEFSYSSKFTKSLEKKKNVNWLTTARISWTTWLQYCNTVHNLHMSMLTLIAWCLPWEASTPALIEAEPMSMTRVSLMRAGSVGIGQGWTYWLVKSSTVWVSNARLHRSASCLEEHLTTT